MKPLINLDQIQSHNSSSIQIASARTTFRNPPSMVATELFSRSTDRGFFESTFLSNVSPTIKMNQTRTIFSPQTVSTSRQIFNSSQDNLKVLSDILKLRSPQIQEIQRQKLLAHQQTLSPILNKPTQLTLSDSNTPQQKIRLKHKLNQGSDDFKSYQALQLHQREKIKQDLKRIKANAKGSTDTGQKAFDHLNVYKRGLCNAADLLPKLNYDQQMLNKILDIICFELGVDEDPLKFQAQENNDQLRSNTIKNYRQVMKKDIVVIQPCNTIEDIEGVLNDDQIYFNLLDLELRNKVEVVQNRLRRGKTERVPISGVKLPEVEKSCKQLLKVEQSDSIRFQRKPEQFYKPRKSLNRAEEQEQILENIRLKMLEPGFESKKISGDIAEYIQKFENANCFDQQPTTLTFRQKQDLKLKMQKLIHKKKIERMRLGIETESSQEDGEEIQLEDMNGWRRALANAIRARFKSAMKQNVLRIVNLLSDHDINKMISEHQEIINKEVRMPKKSIQNSQTDNLQTERVMPMKPRERFNLKKVDQAEAYKNQLANTYISRYNDISHETADYYKQRAINLYFTEQFCKSEQYLKSKHKDLIQQSLQNSNIKQFQVIDESQAQKELKKIVSGEQIERKNVSDQVDDFLAFLKS